MTTTINRSEKPGSLSRAEKAKLVQLEDVVATAKRWAVEEAKALLEIKERGLWRGQYETFEEYGRKRWGYEHSQLYRLVRGERRFARFPRKGKMARSEKRTLAPCTA